MRREPCRWVAAAMVLSSLALTAGRADARRIVRHQPEEKPATASTELYRSAILMDAASRTVLFEKDAHRQGPPASMTKMMLMLIVAERVRDGSLHWDDPIPTSAWASKIGGSQVYLRQGEVFSLAEMMQAFAIHSANDAAVAVAEAVAGSSDAFVDLMNDRARELGMHDTVYHSVHGLPPSKGQRADMTSAYDLATLASELVNRKRLEPLELESSRKSQTIGGIMKRRQGICLLADLLAQNLCEAAIRNDFCKIQYPITSKSGIMNPVSCLGANAKINDRDPTN